MNLHRIYDDHRLVDGPLGLEGELEVPLFRSEHVGSGKWGLFALFAEADLEEAERARAWDRALAAAAVVHPSLPELRASSSPDQDAYCTWALPPGEPLRKRCDWRHPERQQGLRWMIDVCAGVSALHQENCCHGRLSPSTVWISRDEIAFVVAPGLFSTARPPSLDDWGSAAYRAPELLNPSPDSQPLDTEALRSADVWSLGALLYELCQASLPYPPSAPGMTGRDLARWITASEPPQRTLLPDHTPAEILRILNRSLVPEPAERYSDASEMLDTVAEAHRQLHEKPRQRPTLAPETVRDQDPPARRWLEERRQRMATNAPSLLSVVVGPMLLLALLIWLLVRLV